MLRLRRALMSVALTVGLVAVPGSATAAQDDILSRLRAIPGLTVVVEHATSKPYRFFELSYTQYVDHRRPSAGTFRQRLTLLHRSTQRPMVLHTTGYGVYLEPSRAEPTRLLAGNQISVEQRFFTPSRPKPADWSKLTIWQAATDHHRIVAALKPLYTRRWISTGASKGGMTSVYHRRFYPADVAGTVAYVAPNDVVNRLDGAYDRSFAAVGIDPACRAALDKVQAETLRRRKELVGRYVRWAAQNRRTFTYVGSADRAFEFMVNGTTWAFWQYLDQRACDLVPRTNESSDTLWTWLGFVYGWDANTDQGLARYVPYYHQASTQLGYPDITLAHLARLQRYRGQDKAEAYLPPGLTTHFRPFAMLDVDTWVRLAGRQLMFVYGQNDPWGAEPFRLGPGTRDSYWYVAPGANHGANISQLPTRQASQATAALLRWGGVAAPAASGRGTAAPDHIPALDDWKPVLDRRSTLPPF